MNETKNKVRINRFDNLKGLAIFLIVLGHMSFLTKYESISFIHNFVFIFHLSVFFFVAGYFSKIDENIYIKSINRILMPYILFTIIYWILYLPFGRPSPMIFIYPSYALWFLLALFFMKIILPIVVRFRYPLLLSLGFALLFGFAYSGDILALSRTFVFFPVFLIGFNFKHYKNILKSKERLNEIINDKYFIMIISIIVLASSILLAYHLPLSIIMMKEHYASPYLLNMIIRLIIILLGIVITLILNRFMTNKECFLTKWGRNSMAIYMFHIFFIVILKKFTLAFFYQQGEIVGLAFTFAVSILIVWALSQDIVSELFNRLLDAFSNLILRWWLSNNQILFFKKQQFYKSILILINIYYHNINLYLYSKYFKISLKCIYT